ncbi:MAG: nickel pincer cofactor biosynthesis protein LarC [Lachnospiraceae bacterium]|nr:nickel pincer cofactor biosynthesis protein LarC [Lachnospiraceae bacterium]
MGKTVYIESTSGISGDMVVGALLDLGADADKLKKALLSLPLEGYEIIISRKRKNGIDVCDFDVRMDKGHENHDHDMAYLYGHLKETKNDAADGDAHGSEHHGHLHDDVHHGSGGHPDHGDEDGERYEHSPAAHHHGHNGHSMTAHHHGHNEHSMAAHHHEHRGLMEVTEIIDAGELTDGARALALKIFDILAEAEAKAHRTTKDAVHFHEVGSVDSIVDITAAAVCIDDLGIDRVILPQLVEGKGTIRCAHGILPVPVPAVTAILSAYPIPLRIIEQQGELVTPTGAAIAAALMTDTQLPEIFSVKRTGIGGGKRMYERPSMLRVIEIEDAGTEERQTERTGCLSDTVIRLETDIDDCTGEELGYLIEQLYDAGAREVHYSPVYMKKNRPGVELTVLCDEKKVTAIEDIIFVETTTIGIRKTAMQRRLLERKAGIMETKYGYIAVKTVTLPDGSRRTYPEYESLKAAAQKHNVSLQEVRAEVIRAGRG